MGRHDLVLLLEAGDDAVDGGLEVLELDAGLVVARRDQSRLIANVRYIINIRNRI